MITFQGDPNIKAKYLEMAEKSSGNSVGWGFSHECTPMCVVTQKTLKPDCGFVSEHGLPDWFTSLVGCFTETIQEPEARRIPSELLEAVPVGVNLFRLRLVYCAWLLRENLKFLERLPDETVEFPRRDVVSLIDQCICALELPDCSYESMHDQGMIVRRVWEKREPPKSYLESRALECAVYALNWFKPLSVSTCVNISVHMRIGYDPGNVSQKVVRRQFYDHLLSLLKTMDYETVK